MHAAGGGTDGKVRSFGLNIIKTKVDRMWQEFSQNLAHRLAEPVNEVGRPALAPPIQILLLLQHRRRMSAKLNAEVPPDPLVWVNMDQATLDMAYNQAAYADRRRG